MPRQHSSIFQHITSRPDPGAHPALWAYRQQQCRPLVSNPFEPNEHVGAGIEAPELPNFTNEPDQLGNEKPGEEPKGPSQEDIQNEFRNLDLTWGEQAPEWLNLLYDLAWTATFANLTSNYSFVSGSDIMTYAVLFTMAWWIWVSQVFYSIDFYTDDWFHLLATLSQFGIFGALAAFTQGLDLTTYITHSPGSDTWSSDDIRTMTPEVYVARRLDRQMFQRIALVVALSRLLLLVQHVRVVICARITSKSKRCPRRFLIVPASLFISTGSFFAAYVLTRLYGEKKTYAIAKLALWLGGVLVEVVAHVVRFQWGTGNELRLKSHGSIVNRFTAVTTIIVGEGINAIAGTLYGIEKAPGFKKDMVLGSVCSGLIIFFLVYLYFQGSAQLRPVRRRAAWALLHMPWLLCVILLLQSIKNQIVLTNFLNSADYTLEQNNKVISSNYTSSDQFDASFAERLLQAGMTLNTQYDNLKDLEYRNLTATNVTIPSEDALTEIVNVWYLRLQMEGVVNIYLGLMENSTVSDEVQNNIIRYRDDYDFTLQDYRTDYAYNLMDIIWGLMKPSVDNTRFIMGLCGGTFILLAVLNLVQSLPRDRFQWASIISRLTVGVLMALLSLLNIGQYQTYFTPGDIPASERAGIFGWIDKGRVLPTLAGAYVFQFVIDTILIYAARRASRRHPAVSGGA